MLRGTRQSNRVQARKSLKVWFLEACDGLRHRARVARWPADLATGRRGEDLAHRYLRANGLTIVARNYTTRDGRAEVDIVAREEETLVFVEVKTRAAGTTVAPSDAVDREKRVRLIRAALDYAHRSEADFVQARFDVVSVWLEQPPRIEHHRDAFGRRAQAASI